MNLVLVIKRKMEFDLQPKDAQKQLGNKLHETVSDVFFNNDASVLVSSNYEHLQMMRFLPIMDWLQKRGEAYNIFDEENTPLSFDQFVEFTDVLRTEIRNVMAVIHELRNHSFLEGLKTELHKDERYLTPDEKDLLKGYLGVSLDSYVPSETEIFYLFKDLQDLLYWINKERALIESEPVIKLEYTFESYVLDSTDLELQ